MYYQKNMKRLLPAIALLILFCTATFAQTDVYLKINHKLADKAFAFNQEATSASGDKFNLIRLQYYISNIILVHDGGQMTPVADTWILVDASGSLNQNLGNFNITTLEEIRFAIGVNAEVNHNDPAGFPTTHPLYPQTPSMHWGWLAGYRFVALEGNSSDALDQMMELHALGDENYFQQIIATAGTKDGQNLTVELNADYTQALDGIDISQGVILHSNSDACTVMLENFATKVFTSSEGNNSVLSTPQKEKMDIQLYPNPSNGSGILQLADIGNSYLVKVYNLQGKLCYTASTSGNLELNGFNAGMYIIHVEAPNFDTVQLKWLVNQ